MLGYLASGVVGFFIGVILSCVLLSKRGLEAYQKVQDGVSTGAGSVKTNFEAAKAVYRATIDEYENGTDEDDAEEAETESEEAEEE